MRSIRYGWTVAIGAVAVAAAVVATTARATSHRPSGRVAARATNMHSVRVTAREAYLIIRGDGSTDLDCWLYDARGTLVDIDTDSRDYCVLSATASGVHRLLITNLGDVYNDYVISHE